MPFRPEKLLPQQKTEQLQKVLLASWISRKVLAAAQEQVNKDDEVKAAMLREVEGADARLKGKAVAIRFLGGHAAEHYPDMYDMPPDNYRVGRLDYYLTRQPRTKVHIVRLMPCQSQDVETYLAVFDDLEPATLAEVNATHRMREQQHGEEQ